MQSYVTSTGIVLQASFFLLAAFFVFLYRRKRQAYLLAWSAAWFLVALHFLSSALGVWFQTRCEMDGLAGSPERIHLCICGPRLLLGLAAVREPQGTEMAGRSGSGGVRLVDCALSLFARRAAGGPGRGPDFPAGCLHLLARRTQTGVSSGCATRLHVCRMGSALHFSLAFILDSLSCKGCIFCPLIILPELFACVLMVMSVYEEERRRAERNMLALSNLNLVTGSFVGGEIQKMLGQALDRVLSVVRVPAGALCVQQGETSGAASVIVAGLNDSFSSAIQESELNDYFINLVARLGGLVVFRDLTRDASWRALEKDDAFRRIRQLLLDQGLRTIVGISLQAKERVFGVLLLGSPDNRSFGPAERRLLLALGQQIGMAVENSSLIRQTSRRSEELHILNEIGRALSSTLDLDKLLERIYSEMRRVVDAGSFFIAYHDRRQRRSPLRNRGGGWKTVAEAVASGRQPNGGIRCPHRAAASDSRALLRRSGAAGIRNPGARGFAMRGTFDPLRSSRGCNGRPQPEGTRIRRRPCGVSARPG